MKTKHDISSRNKDKSVNPSNTYDAVLYGESEYVSLINICSE